MGSKKGIRHLILIFGDQLTLNLSALRNFDPQQDHIWMAEVRDESTKVWVHKARIVYFLSAMRHFKQRLEENNYPLTYYSLDDLHPQASFTDALTETLKHYQPEKIIYTEPGEYAIQHQLEKFLAAEQIDAECRIDDHFLSTKDEFNTHAKGRKQLRMEYFYRDMRRKHAVLLDGDGNPEGGEWNYDHDNRGSFGKQGPTTLPDWPTFKPDAITEAVMDLVNECFSDHPGVLEHFNWPVTPDDAKAMLQHFITHRLPVFGQYQDAMWTDQPFLYHSGVSAAINLKLLDPRWVIQQAENAYYQGQAPLASVEGFIRQILGWREFIRGMYWYHMPDYLEWNALDAQLDLPQLYWTGNTQMQCLKQAVGQTLQYGYAHHIQRLMVTGLFALLLGVQPSQIHQWYLAVYVDAVEWVELPNTLGMCQYVDGGKLASKPYIASGNYIHKMSNYCTQCAFNYKDSVGETACPFTTLYWDFLIRHQETLNNNARMGLQLRNVGKKSDDEKQAIQQRAQWVRDTLQADAL